MASPSAWPRRRSVAALALAGCGISIYLSLFECHVIGSIWDPIFGSRSSEAVLRSPVSRALPVPDAAAGAAAYAVEAALVLSGGTGRWRRQPWLALLCGLLIDLLALTGVAQVLVQWLVVRSMCALCLTVAAISFLNAWLVRKETAAALETLRARQRGGAEARPGWTSISGTA
jgi:uncharacterized membrane protein